jgi:hypothetical protein
VELKPLGLIGPLVADSGSARLFEQQHIQTITAKMMRMTPPPAATPIIKPVFDFFDVLVDAVFTVDGAGVNTLPRKINSKPEFQFIKLFVLAAIKATFMTNFPCEKKFTCHALGSLLTC